MQLSTEERLNIVRIKVYPMFSISTLRLKFRVKKLFNVIRLKYKTRIPITDQNSDPNSIFHNQNSVRIIINFPRIFSVSKIHPGYKLSEFFECRTNQFSAVRI